MSDDPLLAELEKVRAEKSLLEEQLMFSRQKASLYYIAASELDALKRASEGSFVERKSVGVTTDELTSVSESSAQTDFPADALSLRLDIASEQNRREIVMQEMEGLKRTEKVRLGFIRALEDLLRTSHSGLALQKLLDEYISLFAEFLRVNQQSVNHSIEIKRRDDLISSLFEKMRIMEDGFSRKLMEITKVASARKDVIEELGAQIKDAVKGASRTHVRALQSELEDLKAELSMARTNWAATKDELARLQFTAGNNSERTAHGVLDEYPQLASGQSTPRNGFVSAIRSIRQVSN